MNDWIDLTDHAAERWAARSADVDHGPVVAWVEGAPVAEPHGLDADEVRFHRPSGTVLLRRDEAIVTVIDADTAKSALRRALRQLGDVVDVQGGDLA